MRQSSRLKKLEKQIKPDQAPKFLMVFSDQDEAEKIAKHKAEFPNDPYNLIRIVSVKPGGSLIPEGF